MPFLAVGPVRATRFHIMPAQRATIVSDCFVTKSCRASLHHDDVQIFCEAHALRDTLILLVYYSVIDTPVYRSIFFRMIHISYRNTPSMYQYNLKSMTGSQTVHLVSTVNSA